MTRVDDTKKLEHIYEKYRKQMYFSAFDILKNKDDAEDALHEAFISILRSIDKIKDPDSPKTRAFVLIVAQSRAIDILRKRRPSLPLTALASVPIQDIQADVAEKNAVALAIASLPFDSRRILLLRYDMGLSFVEIADITGKSLFAVYKASRRAKQALSKALAKEEVELS